ncbi:LPS O-antigen length regulator, partial [Vibrio parahaemolyticus]
KTAVADMQSTFYKLIEEQTKSLMLAEVQEEFIFKVVDPAVVPELEDGPKRALICVLGTLLGGMLGVAIVLVRFAFRKEDIEGLDPRS